MPSVLAIDDDTINRITLKHMLSKAGYDVTLAHNGEEGLELLRSGLVPDLIITDIEMPVMDGRQVLHALRTDHDMQRIQTVPTIALTAHTLKSDKESLLQQGFNALVCKPVDEADLLNTLKSFF